MLTNLLTLIKSKLFFKAMVLRRD